MDNGMPPKSKLKRMAEGYEKFSKDPVAFPLFDREKQIDNRVMESPQEAEATRQRFKDVLNKIPSTPLPTEQQKMLQKQQEADEYDALMEFETDQQKKLQYQKIRDMLRK